MNLGAKYELGYSSKAVWGVGVIVSLPTGNAPFTAGHAQYTSDFNWTYAFNSTWSLSGTVSANALSAVNAGGEIQPYFAWVPSVALSASLPQNSSLYVEYAYYSRTAPNLGAKSLIDGGYIRDFGPNLQFDMEYGDSPTPLEAQTQHYVGAGLSVLY
jgi:hypothetical protein